MSRLLKAYLVVFIVSILAACSSSEDAILDDVSGVWSENTQNFIEFRLDESDPYMVMGMLISPDVYPKCSGIVDLAT